MSFGDVENLMEFRQVHWDLWVEFVKDDDDYCPKCSNHNYYCECEKMINIILDVTELEEMIQETRDSFDKEKSFKFPQNLNVVLKC